MSSTSTRGSSHAAASRTLLLGAFTFSFFFFFLAAPSVFGQAYPPEDADTFTIRGIVINSVTHAAVARALVFSADNHFASLTDGDGRFQFKIRHPRNPRNPRSQGNLTNALPPPGTADSRTVTNLFLNARKPGYLDGAGRQVSIDSDGDDPPEVRMSLIPEALITGRVNLPATDGTQEIQVHVYRRQVQEGRANWIPAGSARTRATGEFRLANLHEGDYKLFTGELLDSDPLTVDPRGPLFGYPPAYFPSAADFESAAIIHLQAGQIFSATLTPSRKEYYRVRIGVVNVPPGAGVGVFVEPQGHRGPGYSLGFNTNDSAVEGTLPNGSYTVEAISYGENGSTGTVNFSVNGAPVRGLNMALVPNGFIEARVRDERTKSDNNPPQSPLNLASAFNVRLAPTGEFTQANVLWLRPSRNQEDESLQVGGAPPGTYRVRAGCYPWGYVASVNSGGRDLLQQPLVVGLGAAIPTLEITIRDDGAELQGTIDNWPRDERMPMPRNASGDEPTVVLLPAPDGAGQFCQMPASPTGEFSFPQVPPGEYRVIAFDHLPQDLEYENHDAMQKYDSNALAVRLVVGQKERVRLTLTAWGD